MLTTVVGYLAQLEVPIMRPPHDPGLLDAFAAGRAHFDDDRLRRLSRADPRARRHRSSTRARPAIRIARTFVIDVAKDGDGPKIEPKYAGDDDALPRAPLQRPEAPRHGRRRWRARPRRGRFPRAVFLTRPLWGLAETAPYLHDGRAPTVHDAIVLHGGEATAARDAYLALDEHGRASVRVFLASLSRQPKLFVP